MWELSLNEQHKTNIVKCTFNDGLRHLLSSAGIDDSSQSRSPNYGSLTFAVNIGAIFGATLPCWTDAFSLESQPDKHPENLCWTIRQCTSYNARC
jgi:hypothetical protein